MIKKDKKMPLQILSTNAGGKLASGDDHAAFMSSVKKDHPGWQIVYIAEADARLASFDTLASKFGGRSIYRRHWPGPGSFAMAVVIRSSLAPFVRGITPLWRCIHVQVSVGGGAVDSAPLALTKKTNVVLFLRTAVTHRYRIPSPNWRRYSTPV